METDIIGREAELNVQADEGEQIGVHAFVMSPEEAFVRLEISDLSCSADAEDNWITLSGEAARRLADALIIVADAIDRNGMQIISGQRRPSPAAVRHDQYQFAYA